jgi:lipopolysaccharide/colanic/teichoic acid biosynthesis glycosyltransferase
MPPITVSASRRSLDIIGSCVGLVLLGLPLLVVMALIRLSSRGPAIFVQERVGERGRPFAMYKLRTMRAATVGPDVTAIDDPRVTRIGKYLRRTSVDELPELWNVLRGDMTLVGPRPETPGLARRYPAHCQWIFQYRPGLTGPAQVRMRDVDVLGPGTVVDERIYLTTLVPARVALDASYLERPTVRATFSVLLETLRHVLGSRPQPAESTAAGTAR